MPGLFQDNRTALKVSDDDGNTYHTFTIAPVGKGGGRGLSILQRPWESGDPQKPFRVPLHPWMGGLSRDRITQLVGYIQWVRQKAGYAKGNCNAYSIPGSLLFPPLLNDLTLTGATAAPFQCTYFDGVLYVLAGRHLFAINSAYSATLDKDFGAGKAGTSMAVFNGELIVAMGETEKIWKRSLGASISGTANAAVTSDATSLTDTRLALATNAYVGATVTCNGKTLVVTSNTATVFTGASWSGGGNPGNGNAWSATGTWTQATDATYAIALGTVGNKLWRAESTNLLSNCLTAPLILANYAPTGAAKMAVGDTTWPVLNITDYGGIPWVGKGDGLYAPDSEAKFRNQCPQIAAYPHADNTKGIFLGWGALWCPSASGLFRILLGESKKRGPEITLRPDYRFWVRGGLEWGGSIYLLCTDEAAGEKTFICRMERDEEGLTPNEYRYHEAARLAGTTKGYFIGLIPNATNPSLVAGYGTNAVYCKLGRNAGADTDDANYAFGTAMELETGLVAPSVDASMRSVLLGVEVLCDFSRPGESLALQYAVDTDASYNDLAASAETGSGGPIVLTDGYETVRRYAPPGTIGQFFKFKFSGALTSASGPTARPEIREAWAYGYVRPRLTDQLTISLVADNGVGAMGNFDSDPGSQKLDLWRRWHEDGTVLRVMLNDYEEGRTTRFIVAGLKAQDIDTSYGVGGGLSTSYQIQIDLIRTDFAGEYTAA